MRHAASSGDLFEAFAGLAGRDGARVLIEGAAGGDVTAAALVGRVTGASRALASAGVGSGDLVLADRLRGDHLVAAALAIWSRDAALLPAGERASESEIARLVSAFGPKAVLSQHGPALAARGLERPGEAGAVRAPRAAIPSGTAVIKLTSGSAGQPRGIAVTAAALRADTAHIIEGMKVGPDDLILAAIPMSHSYGMDSLLMPLAMQGTPIRIVSPLPGPLAQALSIDRPAIFPGVPYLFEVLARGDGPAVAPRGLKTCLSAGALLRPEVARAFRERTGTAVRSFYGTSETGGIAFDASPDGDAAIEREGGIGAPLPGVTVSLEGDENRIVVRGDNVAAGYLGDPDPDRESDGAFADGAFRTGDLGAMLERDGRTELILTGRAGLIVNVSGRKVNPREVERELLALPGVRDAAVLGVPDPARGQALVAFVAADRGVRREGLMAHLRERLSAWKLPRRVVLIDALPRTDRGKPDTEALRASALSGQAREAAGD